jgi:hypothetical protein
MAKIDPTRLTVRDKEVAAEAINERLASALTFDQVARMKAASHHFGVPKQCEDNVADAYERLAGQLNCEWRKGKLSIMVQDGKAQGIPYSVTDLAATGWEPCLTA